MIPLKTALSAASLVVDRRATRPILEAVLLQPKGDVLVVTAANASDTVEIDTVYTGTLEPLAVRLESIQDVLSEGNTLVVSGDGAAYRLHAFPAAEFPATTQAPDGPPAWTVDAADLRRALDTIAQCLAPDDNRYGLKGAHVETVDGRLRVVSCDGNRLAWAEAPMEGTAALGRGKLIARSTVMALRALPLDGPVEVRHDDRWVWFSAGPVRLVGRLLEADFPDYRQVLPATYAATWTADRDALIQAFRRAGVLARDSTRATRMTTTGDTLTLSSRALDRGSASVTVPCSSTVDRSIGINATYVLDTLAQLPPGTVTIQLGATSTSVTCWTGDARALFILMPVRLD